MSSKLSKPPVGEVVWHGGQVRPEDRIRLLSQVPVTVWFTGLSAAGKSTLAFALERRLVNMGRACYVLDGDNVRHGLSGDLGFSHRDRSENMRRVSEVAHLMNDAGLIVIAAFISPYREDRALAKSIVGPDRYFEVYVSTPLATCEARDPKGMYKRAKAGQIDGFTGVGAPYEPPEAPVLAIDTSAETVEACTQRLIDQLTQRIKIRNSL